MVRGRHGGRQQPAHDQPDHAVGRHRGRRAGQTRQERVIIAGILQVFRHAKAETYQQSQQRGVPLWAAGELGHGDERQRCELRAFFHQSGCR